MECLVIGVVLGLGIAYALIMLLAFSVWHGT